MIRAYLQLEWYDEEDQVCEAKRTPSIEMVCLPRVGERMRLDDDTWTTVTDILHVAEWMGCPEDDDAADDDYVRPYIIIMMRVRPPLPPLWPDQSQGL